MTFSLYKVEERLDYMEARENSENTQIIPLFRRDTFMYYFTLDMDHFVSHSNHYIINKAILVTQKILIWAPPKIFLFLTLDTVPIWRGPA